MKEETDVEYFDPGLLAQYLTIEFHHSFDAHRLYRSTAMSGQMLESYKEEEFNTRALLSLLAEFYEFLATVRYSVTVDTPEPNPCQTDSAYNQFVRNRYEHFIGRVNNFIIKLFKPDPPRKAELLESLSIYMFYHLIPPA